MNPATLRNSLVPIAAVACAACFPTRSQAANFLYHVDVNVTSLFGTQPTGTYYLDVQLNGDGAPATGTNAVTLSNFAFSIVSGASGAATTYEGASGSLTSGIILSLTSTNNLNELYQGFTLTTTDIQFDVSTTQSGSGITPDLFLVEILNNSLNPIATNAADGVSLLDQPINGPVTLSSVQTYHSASPAGVTVSVVPEPSTWATVALGFGRWRASSCAAAHRAPEIVRRSGSPSPEESPMGYQEASVPSIDFELLVAFVRTVGRRSSVSQR